jgi:hypothetical protein
LPSTSSTRWITNITSGRPASYSSKHSAHGFCSAKLGDLLAVADDDGVLADQVDTADVAVQVDADAGPVEARRHLLDMRRFARAVIALDHDAAVEGEPGEDRQRRVMIEDVGVVDVGDVFRPLREAGDRHIHIDPECLTHRHFDVGCVQFVSPAALVCICCRHA